MSGSFLVVRGADLLPGETPISPEMAWQIFERAINHPRDPMQLAAIVAALSPGGVRAQSSLRQAALRKAIYDGTLALLTRPKELSARAAEPAGASVAEQLKEARAVTTWVEMELVDMAGKPVPGAKYLCMLPDGAMRDGALDGKGRVRFDSIQPGTCAFTFPELDGEAWEREL